MKVVKIGKRFDIQLNYSDSLPAFVDCRRTVKYRGKWDADKKSTFGSSNICSVPLSLTELAKQY